MATVKKEAKVIQFEIEGRPAVLTFTFSYTPENTEKGHTLHCKFEDWCLRFFTGGTWMEIKQDGADLKATLLQQISDGILTTESLVNELSKREGVEEVTIDPHKAFKIEEFDESGKWVEVPLDVRTGAARILVVID